MVDMQKESLLAQLEALIFSFYHCNRGTALHLDSKQRCYEIADILQREHGVTTNELVEICDRMQKAIS